MEIGSGKPFCEKLKDLLGSKHMKSCLSVHTAFAEGLMLPVSPPGDQRKLSCVGGWGHGVRAAASPQLIPQRDDFKCRTGGA